MKQKINYRKYLFEFLSIFIGVTLAFALSKWNDDRKEDRSETKIIFEIKNGLQQDLGDLKMNVAGHHEGVRACAYFRNLINNKEVKKDSIGRKYIRLFRGFISIQNKSGYESLKSTGLELIKDDSLRLEIISLYDFYYEVIEKLEEEYSELQFYHYYFKDFNNILAENMVFDSTGSLVDISQPIRLSKKDKHILLSYLWRIESNRKFTIDNYDLIEKELLQLIKRIDEI